MTRKTYKREFTEFAGVDLRADNIKRGEKFASDNQNVIYGPRGQIQRFPVNNKQMTSGNPIDAGRLHALQLYKFNGNSYGSEVEEILGVSDTANLAKLEEEILNVQYSGGGVGEIKIGSESLDSSYLYLYEDDVLIYSNEVTTTTISALNSAINALTDFSSTIGNTVATMAHLKRSGRREIGASGIDCVYHVVTDIDYAGKASAVDLLPPVSNPSSDHVNGDSVSLNNVLYLNDINDVVAKYDGHYYYPAGLWPPTSSSSGINVGGGGLINTHTYTIATRVKFIDYGGNTHYSKFNFETITLSGGANAISTSITENAGGNGAIRKFVSTSSSGSSTTVPTSATAGQFKVGDTACILDSVNGLIYEEVIGVGATSLTFANTINWGFGDITHSYTFEIWRSTSTGVGGPQNEVGPYYLAYVNPAALGGTAGAFVLDDSDAVITNNEILPDSEVRDWTEGVPAGLKLTKFQNSLVLRDSTDKKLVHFSDQIGQEQFDLAVNNFIAEGNVIGIGSTKEQLAIFKEKNCDVLTGDIQGFSVRIDRIDDNIGCVAHQTIREIDYGVIAFLSARGPYKMVNGIISPLGIHQTQSGDQVSRLEPWFTKTWDRSRSADTSDHTILAMKRAVAVNWNAKNLYVLYVPFETLEFPIFQDTADTEPNGFTYNYDKDAWCRLKGHYMMAGAQEDSNGDLISMNREETAASANQKYLGSMYVTQQNDDKINFPNFLQAEERSSKYSFSWNHMGSPSLLKKWLRARFFTHEEINGQTEFSVNVKAEQDFKSGYTSEIDNVGFTLGTERKVKLSGMRARALRIEVESIPSPIGEEVESNDWSINGMVLEWAQPYRGEFKE